MSRLNLTKLLYDTPGISAVTVEQTLEKIFFRVVTEYRNEILFNYQIRCQDEFFRTRLIIRFGWSDRKNGWIFEPLKGDDK